MDTQRASVFQIPKLSYSLAEVEILTSLSRPTIARAIAAGDLGSIKHGRRRLVPDSDLRDFIERKRALPKAPHALVSVG